MIKIKDIVIPANYVLVKAQEDYENYQIDGRDTGIKSAITLGTAGQRASIFGEVLKVPEKVYFLGEELAALKHTIGEDTEHVMREQYELTRSHSLLYDVPMEVSEGDKIMFFYRNQIDAYQSGAVIDTEVGVAILMKYDLLYAIVKGEDELYPLNGYLFLEKQTLKEELQTKAGIHLLEKEHMGMKFKKKVTIGKIKEVGCTVAGYAEFINAPADDCRKLEPGEYLYYDGRMSRNLQFNLHQTFATPRVVVHRKDVYGLIPNPQRFEFV